MRKYVYLNCISLKMGRFGTKRSDILIREIQKVRVNNHVICAKRETLPYYYYSINTMYQSFTKIE